MRYVIKNSKNKKAADSDEVAVEILKRIENNSIHFLEDFFCTFHRTGILLKIKLRSPFITVPK